LVLAGTKRVVGRLDQRIRELHETREKQTATSELLRVAAVQSSGRIRPAVGSASRAYSAQRWSTCRRCKADGAELPRLK
jgi:hypothetical protein